MYSFSVSKSPGSSGLGREKPQRCSAVPCRCTPAPAEKPCPEKPPCTHLVCGVGGAGRALITTRMKTPWFLVSEQVPGGRSSAAPTAGTGGRWAVHALRGGRLIHLQQLLQRAAIYFGFNSILFSYWRRLSNSDPSCC